MKIAIFGFTGSGKTTVAKIVAKMLNLPHISPTFKDLAARRGMSVVEFQKLAEKDPDIDLEFDKALKEMAQRDCVVSSWLGPWMVEADIKIKLRASFEERVRRIRGREKLAEEKAKEYVREKDENNIKRYKSLYGINIKDEEIFDLIIDTEGKTPEEVAEEIVKFVKRWSDEKMHHT